MNRFMTHLYSKKNIFTHLDYLKFKKRLVKEMPNFAMFWDISEFLILLEEVYFYDNRITSTLFSNFKKKNTSNRELRIKTDTVIIEYTLDPDDMSIKIYIDRLKGNNVKSTMTFYEDKEPPKLDPDDMKLLENIIEVTMELITDLFVYYYKLKWNKKRTLLLKGIE